MISSSYTWDFPALDVYPTFEGQQDVVYLVHWRMSKVSGQYYAVVYNTINLEPVVGEGFIPFASLTKADVQTWVEAALGQDYITALHANLDAQIEEQTNPTTETLSPPWEAPSGNSGA